MNGKRLAIIGLGAIGGSVGARLSERGAEVIGFDADSSRASQWAAETGAPAVADFDKIPWSQVALVFLALRTRDQVTETLARLDSLGRNAPHSCAILTTLAISEAVELAHLNTPMRIHELPVSGGPQGARDGTLSLFHAGPELDAIERTTFESISSKIFWTPGYGQPAALKLCNNALGAINAMGLAHMLELAADHAVDPSLLLEVVSASSGQSWMSENFTGFAADLLFKDVGLLTRDWGALPDVSVNNEAGALLATIQQVRGRLA